MRKICTHTYEDIISPENLLGAWQEFQQGKRSRKDVQKFEHALMENIFALHRDLKDKTYIHGNYEAFVICDPKRRDIHKATVRDRLLHHALYRKLYPFFDAKFISDSYSCRNNKGTHKALERFKTVANKVSKNNTKTVWVLKCDIRKFFASINHDILLSILNIYMKDKDILWLLERIIVSFFTQRSTGLPLGNLTSQLFVNIYMNEFDQFIKHKLKVKCYIRYADDFVIFSHDKNYLESLLSSIKLFLNEKLKLKLHPKKISIETLASGVDFLGWVHFPTHRVLRTVTKWRMFRGVRETNARQETVQSYYGLLKHGNTWKLQEQINSIVARLYNVV